MKKSIKFILQTVTLIFILLAFNIAYSQTTTVTVNFNTNGLTPGDIVHVPVIFNSTATVGTWQVVLYYNRDVLTYSSCTFDPIWVGGIGSPGVNNPFSLPANSPQFPNLTATKISWATSGVYKTCNNLTAFTLDFVYNGGTTNIEVINKSSSTSQSQSYFSFIKNPSTVNVNTSWVNGAASGSLAKITSVLGGGLWSTPSTWDLNHTPNTSNYVVVASAPATPLVVSADATVSGNLTVNDNAALTINSAKTLTVNGNFLLKSTKSSTASFIQNGNLAITGTTKVEKYINGNKWHMLSIPITSATASVFDAANNGGDSIYVKYWLNNAWNWLYSVSTPLVPNQGYYIWADTTYFHGPSPTLNFTGTINNANQNITTLGANKWQMIGNSFTSAIDWSTVTNAANAFASAYYCWNPASGSYASYSLGVSTNGATQFIPAMQGFFIKSLNTNGISLASANKVHNTQPFYKSTNQVNDLVRITASIGNRMDETVVVFDQNATNSLDNDFDVSKLLANDASLPEIYTLIGTDKTVINRFGTYPYALPLNVNLMQAVGNNLITLTASDFNNFDANASIMLEDLLLNTTQNLRTNPTYTFTATVGENSSRFVLHFLNPTFGVKENTANTVNIYSNENNIYVNSKDFVKEISVYNMLGQEVYKNAGNNNQSFYKISLNNSSANYIVRVLTSKGVSTEKVFIK